MPCWNVQDTEIIKKRAAARQDLEARIASGELKIIRLPNGQYAVCNATGGYAYTQTKAKESGWCEGCVLEEISKKGSMAARMKLQAAGIMPGMPFVVASHSGHSHGGGSH